MARFEHSIEVNVPVRKAYNQWTQFEEFPYFMEGVKTVEQRTDTMLHWVAEIAGRTEEWDAEIIDQRPDNRIAWQSTSGAKHSGLVTFHYLAPEKTLIMLVIDYDPQGFIENVGAALGVVERRMAGDLKRFKEYIESHGNESGGWRGEVDPYKDVKPWTSRYTESPAGKDTGPDYVGAPSFTSGAGEPRQVEERGERNDLGDNSFTSGENSAASPSAEPNDNWSTSSTPSEQSSAPLNDIGNSDIAPGEEPAHSMGVVEDEPQSEGWNEDYARTRTTPVNR